MPKDYCFFPRYTYVQVNYTVDKKKNIKQVSRIKTWLFLLFARLLQPLDHLSVKFLNSKNFPRHGKIFRILFSKDKFLRKRNFFRFQIGQLQ